MQPTMQFRWLVRENPQPSADELRAYANQHCLTLMQAKDRMVNRQPPVLQQWHAVEGWEHDDVIKAGGRWEDVPTATEPLGE